MIDIKSDEGEINGTAYGNPAQLMVELSGIATHVLLGIGNSVPESVRKVVLKDFWKTIYECVINEIENS